MEKFKNNLLFFKNIPKKYIPVIFVTSIAVISHIYWTFTVGKKTFFL